MTINNTHVSWEKIMLVCTSLVIPFLGLVVTVVIFGTRLEDKLDTVAEKQKQQDKINYDINTKLDTVSNRQERYNYQYNSRFKELEKRRR